MSAHPRRPEAAPIILPIAGPLSDDAGHRPEPRLTIAIEIPPHDGPLDLTLVWFPPMHAPRIQAGKGETRVEGVNGWVGLVTLKKRARPSAGTGSV